MVSIIVPVYNVERYLNECVESVLKLKTDIEIILVDDGSTDSSGALCDALAERDSRIRVIHQPNGGLSAARNSGIDNALGDYVMFLDSDDFLSFEETDLMLSELKPETDVLLGLYNNYYADTDSYKKESCDGFLKVQGNVSIDEFLSSVPRDGADCYMIACRFVVKRELITNNGLLFCEGIYHEDEEWTQRLLCSIERIHVCHRYFYQYRQAREGAITSTVKPKHLTDIFKILSLSADLVQKQPLGSKRSEYLKDRMAMLFLNNMIHLHILKGTDKTNAVKELKRYKEYCVNSLNGRIGTAAKLCIKLFGIRFTSFLLGVASKIF